LRRDLSTFDLAILDFDMPGMNRRDLFLRIRALHARFPILLLSASASTLSPEDGVVFSKRLDKGGQVRHLLDVIAAFWTRMRFLISAADGSWRAGRECSGTSP
jgi:CheY-like chemotaxis protein